MTKVKVSTIFECSLERAFKTPMLCDISRVHTGYGLMPKVTHTTNDQNWGQPNSRKKIFTLKSRMQKGGFSSCDKVLERVENQYWKIQVDDFQFWVLGFYKFIGEWKTNQLDHNKVQIEYTYSMYFKNILLYPLNILQCSFWFRSPLLLLCNQHSRHLQNKLLLLLL